MQTVLKKRPWVQAVTEFQTAGPWPTKSGAELQVPTAASEWPFLGIPIEHIQQRFLKCDEEELGVVPADIRGFRIYLVRKIPRGSVGGTEFHRIRQEMVFGLEGRVSWECEDVYSGRKQWILSPGNGLWMPPYILHNYEALEEGSGLLVVANTLFNAEDRRMYDSYPREEFERLQAEHRESA